MTPELDNWLTRFAAGAGTAYQWHYEMYMENADRHVVYRMIRAAIDDSTTMCPLSANETYESGEVLNEGEYFIAARQQGLTPQERSLLVDAADEVPGYDPEVRERLRRICRLEEPNT